MDIILELASNRAVQIMYLALQILILLVSFVFIRASKLMSLYPGSMSTTCKEMMSAIALSIPQSIGGLFAYRYQGFFYYVVAGTLIFLAICASIPALAFLCLLWLPSKVFENKKAAY